jgi:hypothetical protein
MQKIVQFQIVEFHLDVRHYIYNQLNNLATE